MASIYKEKSYQFQTDAGAPLSGGKLYFYTTGTETAKNTYTSEALSTPNANPVVLDADGRSANQIWISGRYRVILKTSADVTISDDDVVEDSVSASDFQDNNPTYGGNNSGTANALVFSFTPALTAYTAGQVLRGRITGDNNAAVTINCDGLGVKSLVKRNGVAMASGDLQGPDMIEFVYDSTTDVMRLATPDGAAFVNSANTFSLLQTFSLGADMTPAAAPSTTAVGYLGAPGNKQNAAYTFVMADAGWGVYHDETTARVWTIPPESGGGAVAFPRGTIIVIDNTGNSGGAPGALTIAITTDTLRRGDGVAGTGSRTVPANAVASIRKSKSVAAGDATTEWVISGVFT